tara:strand:+ start:872 stop:1420 length:549 start_codon:yes stop_codon:yes gene_type:complete
MIITEVKDVICHLKSGEVIGYPTEAVYGIGCDPWNQSSVEKIAKIKGRKKRQTFLMVASSIDQLTDLIDISRLSSQVKSSWPGHTTWLIKAKENVPYWLQDEQTNKVGVRVSNHPLVRELCNEYGKPIISTSANISGKEEIKNQQEFIRTFSSDINYLVDGDLGDYDKASMIIDMETNRKIR